MLRFPGRLPSRTVLATLPAFALVSMLIVPASAAGPLIPTATASNGEDAAAVALPSVADPPSISTAFDPTNVTLGLTLVKSGLSSPVLVTNAGDGSGRLFVVEQTGRVRIINGGTLLPTPFIDLHTAISCCGERGLLGLAFNPAYPALPYFYVNFTDKFGTTIVDRFKVSADADVADRASGVRVLTIKQPYPNHNGGGMAFGPDGDLYIGTGDGGSAGDPGNRAQSVNTLLGKMLRIDVNHGSGTRHYAIPPSNPYVGKTGLDEIWSRGLRNPWRWSFDRATGALWIGDVGQNRYEEIDRSLPTAFTPAGRGTNYGWRILEGRACYNPSRGCSTAGKTMPLVTYAHASTSTENCAVTGGYVYRGSAYPVLVGGYLFGDYCSGRIWVVSASAGSPATPTLIRSTLTSPRLAISSFGEDEAGELYVVDLHGSIYQITATAKA